MAVSLEEASIQQLAPICLCHPVHNPLHCYLALLARQFLRFVSQAGDLQPIQEVHDQQAAGDKAWDAARNLDLL